MLGNRSWDDWVAQYASSHRHPFNRACHTAGIPLIALSLLLLPLSFILPGVWKASLTMFLLGWFLQFIGHAVEGKRPEFFGDWRFLLVGLRWWFAKMAGKA
jgi:uncharacterized membrane protein YGL010W